MHSSLLLPSIAICSAVAQARNTVHQHQIPYSQYAQPDKTCSVTSLLRPENLCFPDLQIDNFDHAHGHHHDHSHNHHRLHEINLDELFESYDDPSIPSPWTHISNCIPDGEKNQTYCVFTNSSYADGRGISFFTTPAIASQVALLPAFTQPTISPTINTFLKVSPDDLPYEVRPIPGRGNGVFATRKLERGDLIMAETPAGVYMSDAFWPDYELGYEYLRKTYDWLPEPTKEEFEALSMHKEGHAIMERVNTNAFAGELGIEKAPHFWVHPRTAMLNHDCRPNAMYHHDEETLIHATIASTTIEEGEEITITYINLLETRAARHELLSVWGFTCTCSLCSTTSFKNEASEARIARILSLQEILADWSPSSAATPQKAEQLIKLYEKERLWAAKGTGHMFAALAYNALGEEEGSEAWNKAVYHARMSVEVGTLASGAVENNRREMGVLKDDPRGHWSWGMRS